MHVSARVSNFYRMHNSEILEGLNDAQREAVMHGEGPAMVVAGPGSGKTTVIIRRLLYLIYELNVPAEKILVITYTKEAALSMQQRFYEQKEHFSINRNSNQGYVSFGTFHSYFFQIIKNIKKYSEYQLITPQEKIKLVKSILKEEKEEISDFVVKRFLEQISFYKNTGRLREGDEFHHLFPKYQKAMQHYKRMDFDDMLYLCKEEFLGDDKLLSTYRERYQYILIDEYQDINPIQYDLMHLLTTGYSNLFVVGDDDQAIYGFRGSDVECFQKFYHDYKDTKTIYLNTNYRCTSEITKASQKLISKNKNRLEKNIISGVEEQDGDITVIGSENSREMYRKLMEHLQQNIPEELNGSAILFRTNSALQSCANVLAGKRIPFVIREKIRSIYEHFISCDIMDFFMAANGCKDRSLYLRIFTRMQIPYGREFLTEDNVDLQLVKESIRNSIYNDVYTLEQMDILDKHLQRLGRMRPELGISYILHAMGYEKYLLSKAGKQMFIPEEWKEALDWLREDVEPFCNFHDWMQHVNENKNNLNMNKKEKEKKQEGIHLLTMHAAKGLEFQKIYILHLNDGIIPKMKRGEVIKEEQIEEERRLFYVALTRAKTNIELHYLAGTKDNPRLISRFLEEIRNK